MHIRPFLVLFFLIFGALFAFTMATHGHGLAHWIQKNPRYVDPVVRSIHCCGPNDCHPVAASRVKILNNGYLVDDRAFYPFENTYETEADQIQISEFWMCLKSSGEIRCFFAPGGAS